MIAGLKFDGADIDFQEMKIEYTKPPEFPDSLEEIENQEALGEFEAYMGDPKSFLQITGYIVVQEQMAKMVEPGKTLSLSSPVSTMNFNPYYRRRMDDGSVKIFIREES